MSNRLQPLGMCIPSPLSIGFTSRHMKAPKARAVPTPKLQSESRRCGATESADGLNPSTLSVKVGYSLNAATTSLQA
jgi:hypothetical protein